MRLIEAGVAATTGATSYGAVAPGKVRLVVAAAAVPDVELGRLAGELHQPWVREELEHRVERALLRDPLFERLLAAEAGGELERLAAVLAERVEGAHQEVAVGDRVADVHRAEPGGEHR